uniref:Calmodulin-binding protein-like n=1 Tax=Oryza brachyantha TaxID=4533 RepID=J3NA31_ORYBR
MMNPRKRPASPPASGAPAQKRLQRGIGIGIGIDGQAPAGKQQLQPRVLYVLVFVARVYLCKRRKEEQMSNRPLRRLIREENAISERRTLGVLQNLVNNAFHNIVNHINSSHEYLTKQIGTFSERIDILSHEVGQLKNSNSNRDANERYRSVANQEHAVVIKEVNQEQRVELRFLNKLNHLVYTKEKISAEDGKAIKIAIFQDNHIVKYGPLSSARIQILALHGNFNNGVPENWTERQFDERIVKSQKGNVLEGDCQVKLKNGEASLSDISFNIPSGKTETGKLILAARVVSSDRTGLRIMEAVMDPVKVQVYRNKQNRISDRPKLKEKVHRLKGIARNGGRDRRLKNNQIYTVEDFKALNKNEEKIRAECFNVNPDDKQWKATVEHARECDLEGDCNLKSYRVQNVVLFFNCVHDLVGAEFHGFYASKDSFSSDQKDAVNSLIKQAYDVLDDIAFNDKMKDNYPVSLSSAMNTITIGVDASVPLTDTAEPNPPDFHGTAQGKALIFSPCF